MKEPHVSLDMKGGNLNPQNRLKRNANLDSKWKKVLDKFVTTFYYNIKTCLVKGKYLSPHNKETKYIKDSNQQLTPLTSQEEFIFPRVTFTPELTGDLPF